MILLSALGICAGSMRRVLVVLRPYGRERCVQVPGVKDSVEVRVIGAPVVVVFMRAMPLVESMVEDSEGGGVGRPVGFSVVLVVLFSGAWSVDGDVMFPGKASR